MNFNLTINSRRTKNSWLFHFVHIIANHFLPLIAALGLSMRRVGVLLLLLLFSYDSLACREFQLPESSWFEKSNSVYVVRVVGISAPTLIYAPYSTDVFREALVTDRFDKIVSLVVYETLKGSDNQLMEVTINWCGGGEVKLGFVGVLYGLEQKWHIQSGLSAVSAFKAALTRYSNGRYTVG